MAQISFVLPFTCSESVTEDLPWRKSVNNGAITRLKVLLYSFIVNFVNEELGEFLIVCPRKQCASVETVLRSITLDARYQVIPEDTWLEPPRSMPLSEKPLAGWYIQQLVKMAAAAYVSTPFYVTLDSDVVCLREFGTKDVVAPYPGKAGKHLVGVETERDYLQLYHECYAEREVKTKSRRYLCSAKLLRYIRPDEYSGVFYGETPCAINTSKMNELLQYLEYVLQQSWQNGLSVSQGWTEYSLYFQYLEMTDALFETCCLGSCNSVLDLKHSVWHHASWYRAKRIYDRDHFFPAEQSGEQGPFIAIQSWLPPSEWLPSRYQSRREFYRDLLGWITVAEPTLIDDRQPKRNETKFY